MKRILAPLLLTLLALLLPVVSSPAVDAQTGVFVSQHASDAATAVVNGQILSTVSVELDAEVYRVSEVAISSSEKGELTGSILVEVPGGERSDGTIVFVSHTPALIEGEMVQLAVSPTETYAGSALPQALGSDLPLYSVVGGTDGAYGLSTDGLAQAQAVDDYVLTGASWPGFSPQVDFKVNPANSGLGESETLESVRKAFDMWEADLGSNVDFNYAGITPSSDLNLRDRQNTVSWVQSSGGWLAQASWITTASREILEFDVRINRSYSWSNGAENGKFDIATVVGHEVGHGIGFAHAPASSELMYFQMTSGATKGLGAGDQSGAAFLYPAPATSAPAAVSSCDGYAVTIDMNTNGGNGDGTNGDDVILGTPGDDVINGYGGEDVVCGMAGRDRINGGDGNDTIFGGDDIDYIFGDAGADTIDGQGGSDRLYGGPGHDLILGDSGADRMFGGAGNDEMRGMGGQDFMWGEDGNDLMQGNHQTDNMWGGPGDDTMFAAGGKDALFGEGGNDSLNGGDNTDYLHGGADVDVANGGRGRDNPLVEPKVRPSNGQLYDGSGCIAETRISC